MPYADERSTHETDVVVTHENAYAAGIPAVLVSLRRGLEQMGALRTARTLLKLNQRNGFDRPGCAWPQTSGHRKHAEFGENGALKCHDHSDPRQRVTSGPWRCYAPLGYRNGHKDFCSTKASSRLGATSRRSGTAAALTSDGRHTHTVADVRIGRREVAARHRHPA